VTHQDLKQENLVLVRNRGGIAAPLSIDTLANSLLASGVGALTTYAIATECSQQLQHSGESAIDSCDLAARAAELLAQHGDHEAADRYRAWRRFRHSGQGLVLCLLGAPGVGKSAIASALSLRLGIHRVVPTDSLREVLRTVIPTTLLPELHVSAYDAEVGESGTIGSGFLRQARAVSSAAAAVAARAVGEGRDIMLVGTHLIPGETRANLAESGCDAHVVELLLTLDDEKLHRARMLRRIRSEASMPGVRHVRNFRAVRQLQRHLVDLARRGGVVQHDLGNGQDLTEWIVDHVVAEREVSNPHA
jgi:2-phosphoglycerate kinase